MSVPPIFVDTHCHLNFDSYDVDRDAIVQAAADAGVTRIVIPAVDVETAQQSLHLSQQYEGVYVAVGVHPNSTAHFDDSTCESIEALSHHAKVVAIGEIGLDYYWDKSPKAQQRQAFEAQLALASQRELPVIIHNREASEDVIAVLEDWVQDLPASLRERPGVLHSFSAPAEIAERALAIGFYLGFTGPITFKNAEALRRVARDVPLNRLLVETDGPFLTPHPYRGKKPNKPQYILYIADRLAGLHQMTVDAMAEQTTANAEHLFQLS
ncbi:MAG: TatD family hydrolase [Anaerolineae bacterium]